MINFLKSYVIFEFSEFKDPKFLDNSSRAKNMDELKKILEEKLF